MKKIFSVLKNNLAKFYCNKFHKFYYNSKVWRRTFWLGTPIQKCPLDLWIYQEIIYKLKPDIIIETGTANGGSALYLANLCDLINNGEVITIDTAVKKNRPKHKRITYLTGSSISSDIIKLVKSLIKNKSKIMVILDSDHSKNHVLKELKIYSNFVTEDSYLIVEDTNINGHPVKLNFGLGPWESVNEFLKDNKNFYIDRTKEKFYLTFNPKGFLYKKIYHFNKLNKCRI